MDFLRNVFDYFRGSNTKRDENKSFPGLENSDSQNIPELIPRHEVDVELPPNFINRTFRGNNSNKDDMPGFQSRNNIPFFFGSSNLYQMVEEIINNFEDAMNQLEESGDEMGMHFNGPKGFHNFSESSFGDVMLGKSEQTLTGERLRNYYLNGNTADTYQGENQIDNGSNDNQTNLIINNNNRSDFNMMPSFKSQARYVTTKIGPDGIAEIVTILKDGSGNEERIVRKVKLF